MKQVFSVIAVILAIIIISGCVSTFERINIKDISCTGLDDETKTTIMSTPWTFTGESTCDQAQCEACYVCKCLESRWTSGNMAIEKMDVSCVGEQYYLVFGDSSLECDNVEFEIVQ